MFRRRLVASLVALLGLAGIVFAASALAGTINGSSKNDVLRGTSGADKIYGKGGNDKLYGLGGNDYLNGGPGNDTLVGGPGADRYACGPGRDTVVGDPTDVAAKDCEVVKGLTPPTPAANVVPGRYCGFTSQGMSICFTVTPDRRSFAQGHFGVRVDCTPQSTHEWTIDFPGSSSIKADGSFVYKVLELTKDSEIGGLVGSYLQGTIDSVGNAQGQMHLTNITFTKSGTPYTCDTADATWTAKKQ